MRNITVKYWIIHIIAIDPVHLDIKIAVIPTRRHKTTAKLKLRGDLGFSTRKEVLKYHVRYKSYSAVKAQNITCFWITIEKGRFYRKSCYVYIIFHVTPH